MTPATIVQKLWNYCNVLRDDGMSYLLARVAQTSGDYVEKFTRGDGLKKGGSLFSEIIEKSISASVE